MAKGAAHFQPHMCKGCGLCVAACPHNIVVLDETVINRKGYHPAMVIEGREEECLGCQLCGIMCPDAAITVEKTEVAR